MQDEAIKLHLYTLKSKNEAAAHRCKHDGAGRDLDDDHIPIVIVDDVLVPSDFVERRFGSDDGVSCFQWHIGLRLVVYVSEPPTFERHFLLVFEAVLLWIEAYKRRDSSIKRQY
jgi:hypothetical protein